jgi:gamma-glutamyltranspeptidase/glutathione hydrolase
MTRVAVATTSALAADATLKIAAAGGNAVDCAIGTAIMSMNTEPGVCAFAGGAYVTVWAPGRDPVTIDGIHAIPGLGLEPGDRGRGASHVTMEYGGGVSTMVGPGSVAVPGALSAFERAWQDFGNVPWRELFAPTVAVTRKGFPLSRSCFYYLTYTGRDIFARADDGYRALHRDNDKLREAGSPIVVPHLADSLEAIAERGADAFYKGDIARAIVDHVRAGDGALTMRDMAEYRAIERPAMITDVGEWSIATNPPPAVGGAILTAMLLACAELPSQRWDRVSLDKLIRVHRACLDYRRERLDLAKDIGAEAAELIDAARSGRLLSAWNSSSTVHTSAVDENGTGCSITASAGYGSGEMPGGTGLWLNNGLGELELNRRGLTPGEPGERLPSNMAPSVARSDGKVLAIGTPGADRITTALHQVLVNLFEMDKSLPNAIAHPRIHVDTSGASDRLAAEPGLDLPETDLPLKQYTEPNMYFGGVGAALYSEETGFEVASDPRREGGTNISDS